jgi:hypothetical protein
MAKFQCLETAVINQNYIHEEDKLNYGNAFYNPGQDILPSRLVSKKRKS